MATFQIVQRALGVHIITVQFGTEVRALAYTSSLRLANETLEKLSIIYKGVPITESKYNEMVLVSLRLVGHM